MCVCVGVNVCLCVRKREGGSERVIEGKRERKCARESVREWRKCEWMCVRKSQPKRALCEADIWRDNVCICVSERKRERMSERERVREREKKMFSMSE